MIVGLKILCIKDYVQRNDKLWEELKYKDVNSEEFLKKILQVESDKSRFVKKLNNLRKEMQKLGVKVPSKLILWFSFYNNYGKDRGIFPSRF